MSLLDLHTHTTMSDGSLSPSGLVVAAVKAGIGTLAVTDHDTVDGLDEFLAAAHRRGIAALSGVELSVDHENGSMHLLAYGIDHHNSELAGILRKLASSRVVRNTNMIGKLRQLGYPVNLDRLHELAGNGTAGRGHIGRMLVEEGHAGSIEEAFEYLIGKDKPAYIDRYRMHLYNAIRLVHDCGGVAVWAHPGLHEAKLPSLLKLLPKWKNEGLDGIETDYSQHSQALASELRGLARDLGLIATGGSDFHGDLKPDIHLGDGPERQPVGWDCLDQLQEKLALNRSRQRSSAAI